MHKFLIFSIAIVLSFCSGKTMKLIRLIETQQREKQNFEVRDAYKLIYQAVFGVAHILEIPDRAKAYLEQEIAGVDSSTTEKLIEVISVSGDVVRLNLRPYKFYNGDPDLLFDAMVQSAKAIDGSNERFLVLWEEFKRAVENGKLNFDVEQMRLFDEEIKKAGYPAVHHSEAYREANLPAYRVLTKDLAERLLERQKIKYK